MNAPGRNDRHWMATGTRTGDSSSNRAIGSPPPERAITAKDAIKEHIGRSPDYADALSMRLWVGRQPAQIAFSIDFF